MKKPQLFLLHFAGGNCYSFQFLMPGLREFEVIALELPGRGKRMGEPLLKDFDSAAKDIFRQLSAKITSPEFMIYGHSMGAYLTLRVANMLEKTGKSPACIIVSGNAGPGLSERNEKKRYLMETPDLKEELKKIGGVPTELLEHEELFGFFEPILRADFEVAENNGLDDEPPVNVPLYAMMGSEEEEVEEIANWSRYTTSTFKSEVLQGDHFFINKHPKRIAEIMKECYKMTKLVQQ
ncbi:MAG: alpha/beta fold hydrolase [Chitinophagaceae bacterium]